MQRVPEAEEFFCFGFQDLKDAFRTSQELLEKRLTRFTVLCQGDLPVEEAALMHIIITGAKDEVEMKSKKVKSICQTGGGKELDNTGTRNYWKTHNVMYSWLRWKDPKTYYARKGIPYFCPEVFGYLSIPKLVEMSEAFWKYWKEREVQLKKSMRSSKVLTCTFRKTVGTSG